MATVTHSWFQNAVLIKSHYERETRKLDEILKSTEKTAHEDLDRQLKSKMDVVMERQQSLSSQTKKLGRMLLQVDDELRSSPHSKLVRRSASLLKTFDDILAVKISAAPAQKAVPASFNPLLPAPVSASGTLAIDVQQLRPIFDGVAGEQQLQDDDHIFSDPIQSCG
jgi:hypothetical protein